MKSIRSYRLLVISLSLLLLLSSANVFAQQPLTIRIERVDAAAFPQNTVYLTVRDANGVPVRDLTAQSFDVSEDRTLQSRPITKLETVVNAEQPIGIILVLDMSGSMTGKPLADAKSAAVRLLDRLGAKDSAALLAFADSVNLADPFPQLNPAREADFSADKAPLYKLVDSLTAGGVTPLYDAVYKAVRLAARQPIGNRAVLLLSDGRDEGSSGQRGAGSRVANEDMPVREANRSNVPVFVVGLGTLIDAPYLNRLALETGGTYQEAPESSQLAARFQNVVDQLKQQYKLTYPSGVAQDGKMHSVLVGLRGQSATVIDEMPWGPVGTAAAATATPTAVPTATPTIAPTPTPTVTPTPAPPETKKDDKLPWPLIIGVGLLLLVGALALMAGGKKGGPAQPAKTMVKCLDCGFEYDLKDPDMACPSCTSKKHRNL